MLQYYTQRGYNWKQPALQEETPEETPVETIIMKKHRSHSLMLAKFPTWPNLQATAVFGYDINNIVYSFIMKIR